MKMNEKKQKLVKVLTKKFELNYTLSTKMECTGRFGLSDYGAYVYELKDKATGDLVLIGIDAKILDESRVYGNARVLDKVRLHNKAQVYDDACVFHTVDIYNEAEVYGNAILLNNISVSNCVKIYGDVILSGNIKVSGSDVINGSTKLRGI